MPDSLEQRIFVLLGTEIVRLAPVSGGCINAAYRASLADGRVVFVKTHGNAPPGMFTAEAAGLRALAAPGMIRVPEVLAVTKSTSTTSTPAVLVLEFVESGRKTAKSSANLGEKLAALHRATAGPSCGFEAGDNWIGSTPQPNPVESDWIAFWRDHRLLHLLRLLKTDGELRRLGERLADRLPELLASDEPMCLLHGDLWGGNVVYDVAGEPVLIDPAVYRGHREADLSMTRLFGGFDEAFYDAYHGAWPLATGTEARQEIYGLFHLLNHLLLFGESYRNACLEVLRKYAGQ